MQSPDCFFYIRIRLAGTLYPFPYKLSRPSAGMVLCLFYPAFRSSFLFAYTGLKHFVSAAADRHFSTHNDSFSEVIVFWARWVDANLPAAGRSGPASGLERGSLSASGRLFCAEGFWLLLAFKSSKG